MEEQEKYTIKDKMQSPQINELATALAKAQGIMQTAKKDSSNPFFKSVYADLASVWEACREALSSNGLCVIQTTDNNNGSVIVITTLIHSGGQWIRGNLRIKPVKDDPQGIGSAITYARRYALAAIIGVAPDEDDDGEGAMGRKISSKTETQKGIEMTNKKTKPPFADPSSELLHVTQNISNVAIRPGKPGKNPRYIIIDGNKREYGTFSKTTAETAKRAMESGIRAELGYKKEQYGNDLETIGLLDIPPDRPAETRTALMPVCPEDEKIPASIFLCASCDKNKTCPVAKEVTQDARS